jgi:hypothetical protein
MDTSFSLEYSVGLKQIPFLVGATYVWFSRSQNCPVLTHTLLTWTTNSSLTLTLFTTRSRWRKHVVILSLETTDVYRLEFQEQMRIDVREWDLRLIFAKPELSCVNAYVIDLNWCAYISPRLTFVIPFFVKGLVQKLETVDQHFLALEGDVDPF